VEFDYSGSYLAVGGSDVRCSPVHCLIFSMFSNFRNYILVLNFGKYCSVFLCGSVLSLNLCGTALRLYQVASVKQEWNTIKVFPDLSGTGVHDFNLIFLFSIVGTLAMI
jgi:pre-mRNA-processing factor 19